MDFVDTCVIGAGVVGLACARALAPASEVLVLEAGPRYGEGISSRNSEVIHAGIYYPPGSLKAKLCVRGKQMLYEFCEQARVSHRRIGKIIVATSGDEEPALATIFKRAADSGVTDLEPLSAAALHRLEPAVRGSSALLSPSTGIISAHEFMTALLASVEASGGLLATSSRVLRVEVTVAGFCLHIEVSGSPYKLGCRRLVNAAGLSAQAVAGSIDAMPVAKIPRLYYCKGSYFSYTGPSPFNRLIYPVPEKNGAGLGVHATIDMGGQVRFGPDVEYLDAEDYAVSEARLAASQTSIRRYFPGLTPGRLTTAYAGIRPKIQGPTDPPADFVIQGPEAHGIRGLVNLYGIESPGLTSSMAIAETVSDYLRGG